MYYKTEQIYAESQIAETLSSFNIAAMSSSTNQE